MTFHRGVISEKQPVMLEPQKTHEWSAISYGGDVVPTSSSFGRVRRTNEVGYHPSAGRIGNPEVTVLKEVPQTSISIIGVTWADMRKFVDIRVQCRFSF